MTLLRQGRSFANYSVAASQNGTKVFACMCAFKVPEPGGSSFAVRSLEVGESAGGLDTESLAAPPVAHSLVGCAAPLPASTIARELHESG